MFPKILNSPYLPHAIYSLAITSISIHLVSQKRNIVEDKARVTARISILESVSKQLREDKDISLDELDRLHRLARPPALKENGGRIKEVIRWKEVFLGPKKSAGPEMSDLDRQDWEKIKEELESQK